LTGRYPFPEGSAVEKMMAHQTKKPTPVRDLAPEVPEELVAVCDRLMAKTPEARYRGCDEAMEALRPFALSAGGVARLTSRKPTGQPAARMDNGLAEMATAAPAGVTAAGPPARPGGGGANVPTRRSLRDSATPPIAASASTPLPISVPERPVIPQVAPSRSGEIPGLIGGRSPGPSLEERLGPIGMLIIALLAGIGAWFAWTKFFTP
jgi:serine/threonine-protein kinase